MSVAENTEQQSDFFKEVMVARQPIYNKQMGIYAYELLFRSHDQSIEEIGKDNATAEVMLNSFLDMGLENLVGKRLAAINLSEWFLGKAHTLPLPQERIILEIPGDLQITAAAIGDIHKLKAAGFKLAIDNFKFHEAILPLLSVVDILKVDVRHVDQAALSKFVKQIKKFKNLSLLSLKVENRQEFDYYRDMGFSYCQGYLLAKPQTYATKSLSSSKLVVMSLLSILYKDDFDFNQTENVVSRDVSISYKLMKLINSTFFGLPNEVESIQQALVLIGRDRLRSWVAMLALSSMDDCPVALLELTVVRARMCELLAEHANLQPLESYFTVGLFSALDTLLQQPLEKILAELPLSDEIKSAILNKNGPMGEALECVVNCEKSNWEKMRFHSVDAEAISESSYKAFIWATDLMSTL